MSLGCSDKKSLTLQPAIEVGLRDRALAGSWGATPSGVQGQSPDGD